ncbi:unnamed protein product [Adineta ricciae]|uniref:Sema domain-containing protein n=1 Tax=Adineta ricciae TaxID=249248 RepID=A0A815RQA1_ADIRI|nr:unnamed protein product [Adineta ricciae]
MNLRSQCTHLVLIIIIYINSCYTWHQTLKFPRQLSYEHTDKQNFSLSIDMKFFMWYDTYAIYSAREKLILLKPSLNASTIEIYTYNWSIDSTTMEECLQEWNTKEKCYNDIVHVRILPNSTVMDVYSIYAHRPMIRSFNFRSMSFVNGTSLARDPYPSIDSERSYVMLSFNTNLITAGYEGDYIPTIRASQGRTLLYALRQNSQFIDGFKYDGKAVFGVVETSERRETNRVSRLVMACANRAEIIRKATLNCSTNMFDHSRSFVFHILTALIDPIRTANDSVLLFATFTTTDSSLTASAVCLFALDKQFYDVFTASSMKTARTNEINELVVNCSQSIPSTIDRDMVESEKQFLPYSSNPLLIETMSNGVFTAIDVIQYQPDHYCLIIGTSTGRVFTAFVDRSFETKIFEELISPVDMQHSIKSITHKNIEKNSYVIFLTNHLGYSIVKLITCQENDTRLCFQCFLRDCSIRRVVSTDKQRCASGIDGQPSPDNDTQEISFSIDQSLLYNRSVIINRSSDKQTTKGLLFYIVIPLSMIVFMLFVLIILLLTKSNGKIKRGRFYPSHCRKTQDSSAKNIFSHTYTNNIMYKTNPKLDVDRKKQQHVFPIKSEFCVRQIPINPVYSTASSQSLPSLVLPTSTILAPNTPQPLSVRRLYKDYM